MGFFIKRLFRISPSCFLALLLFFVVALTDSSNVLGGLKSAFAAVLNVFNIYIANEGVLPNYFGIFGRYR